MEEQIKSMKDHILMVPAHNDDVQKINEIAEVCREPNEMEEIKEPRHFLHILRGGLKKIKKI